MNDRDRGSSRQDCLLSTAAVDLNWSVRQLFASPIARVSLLRCLPGTTGRSCEKCAVDNQLVFVVGGAFIKHGAHGTHVVNAGKAAVFRRTEPYRTSHLSPNGDACAVFSFPDEMYRECNAFEAATTVAGLAVYGKVLRVIAGLRGQSLGALEVEEEALGILERTLLGRGRVREPGATAARALVRDIESLLTGDPSRDWSLTVLSHQFHRTPFHITRLFRRQLGVPLHRYLLHLRLANALLRLSDGEADLARLALDLGFSSHAHFSAAFRAALGTSPSSFRGSMVKNLKARLSHPA